MLIQLALAKKNMDTSGWTIEDIDGDDSDDEDDDQQNNSNEGEAIKHSQGSVQANEKVNFLLESQADDDVEYDMGVIRKSHIEKEKNTAVCQYDSSNYEDVESPAELSKKYSDFSKNKKKEKKKHEKGSIK